MTRILWSGRYKVNLSAQKAPSLWTKRFLFSVFRYIVLLWVYFLRWSGINDPRSIHYGACNWWIHSKWGFVCSRLWCDLGWMTLIRTPVDCNCIEASIHLNIPTTRKIRYILRNQAKLKLKLNAFGRLTENLSDSSSKGIAFQMRVPEKLK